MRPIHHLGEGACEKTRRYLDSYISNELLVETNLEVLRHLESCPACTAEMEARITLRAKLKGAAERQGVPADLQVRVRGRIQAYESRRRLGWFDAGWTRWGMAVAACLALSAGLWLNYEHERLPAISDRSGQYAYIQRVSARLAEVFKPGLGDHIHCSVFRKYPLNPPTVAEMEETLGPYQGLLRRIQAAVPGDYRVIMAHRCGYAGRRFVHLTLRKGKDLLSVVITRKKEGETMQALPPEAHPAGIPVYQSAAARYRVAGFEAGQYVAFVVSDLRSADNLRIAANLASAIHEFLVSTPA